MSFDFVPVFSILEMIELFKDESLIMPKLDLQIVDYFGLISDYPLISGTFHLNSTVLL